MTFKAITKMSQRNQIMIQAPLLVGFFFAVKRWVCLPSDHLLPELLLNRAPAR